MSTQEARAAAEHAARTSYGRLIALLAAINRAHEVVDHEGLSSREVRKRAKQIAEGAWAAKAVRDAIAAATAATAGAVAATTAATSSG